MKPAAGRATAGADMERTMPLPHMTIGCKAIGTRAAIAALALFTLASCAGQEDLASYPCPLVLPVRDASYMTRFEGGSQDLSDTMFEAKIDAVMPANNCIYRNDAGKRSIVYDIRLQFLAQRGPKEREGAAKFDYFVAVTGVGGRPLARSVFPTEIPFKNNATQAIVVEEVQPTIPLGEGENGDWYRIYVGFMLSEQEMAYNRRNPR
jgi:hypothetical protein